LLPHAPFVNKASFSCKGASFSSGGRKYDENYEVTSCDACDLCGRILFDVVMQYDSFCGGGCQRA
jgi:hypothetical protein